MDMRANVLMVPAGYVVPTSLIFGEVEIVRKVGSAVDLSPSGMTGMLAKTKTVVISCAQVDMVHIGGPNGRCVAAQNPAPG